MQSGPAHLTYCTNIHAGETWADTFIALKNNFPIIKAQVSPDAPMGIGLRLSNIASIALLEDETQFDEFQQWLAANDAYIFTMNGFPYGGFHHTIVKDNVHAPDWTTSDRLDYTLRLFKILAKLLPKGMDGGISTSPLSYKPWYTERSELLNATGIATKNIIAVAEELYNIHRLTGTIMHLDIEPEPDGFLESGQEFIAWFENYLLPAALESFSEKHKLTASEITALIKRHVRLCYDVCHFAIGYEPHIEIIDRLIDKEIQVGKIQISAALKVKLSPVITERNNVIDAISAYNESTYLHQVIGKYKNGTLLRYADLPQALADAHNADVNEWRAHFHVPVFIEDIGLMQSTQADIIEVLNKFKHSPFTQHLEVETYTWEVLPDELRLPLTESIVRELEWVKVILI